MKRAQLRGRERRQRRCRADRARAVAVLLAEDDAREGRRRDRGRIVTRLQQRREPLLAQPFELGGRKRRPRATSAMIGSASSSARAGTLSRTAEASNELVVLKSAPRNSTASAISSAPRAPAPSSSIAAVRLARPSSPGGSSPLPAWTTRFTCTSGTSCGSTSQTSSPFASVVLLNAGSVSAATGRAPAAASGRPALRGERSGETSNRTAASEPSHGAASGSTTSSTRRSAGSHREPPPARLPRQRGVTREVLGEKVGPAAEAKVRVELIGLAAESADAFHAAVERRLDLIQRTLDFARDGGSRCSFASSSSMTALRARRPCDPDAPSP